MTNKQTNSKLPQSFGSKYYEQTHIKKTQKSGGDI